MDEIELSQLFKALSDANRIQIVEKVAQQDDICACKLLEDLAISQPTLSHHMKVLCESGLVTCRKEGKWMHYSLNRPQLTALQATLDRW